MKKVKSDITEIIKVNLMTILDINKIVIDKLSVLENNKGFLSKIKEKNNIKLGNIMSNFRDLFIYYLIHSR